jgi:hypothetical protein
VPPAVANALYDAVGVRVDEVPITPEKVMEALALKERGESATVAVPEWDFPEPIRWRPGHPERRP